jgi:chromosome partitioning protein
MTTFLTLAHQKGGVGKSTLALNLYGYFNKAGLKTAIVDIDPQGTITEFASLDPSRLTLIKRKEFADYADLKEKTKGFDLVVIDTPPYLSNELKEIFKITNFLLIPCKPSLFDALAIRHTLEFIRESKGENSDNFLCAIVLTMVISASNLQEQTREVLEKYDFPILNTEIGNRTAYVKSLMLSGNILDDDSGKAKEEIENLAQEILNLISKV